MEGHEEGDWDPKVRETLEEPNVPDRSDLLPNLGRSMEKGGEKKGACEDRDSGRRKTEKEDLMASLAGVS